MRISTDVLYGLLSEKYTLDRFGKGIRGGELSLPVFYEAGRETVRGQIYVARTGDLPNKPPEDCLFICCGTRPPRVWNMWPCEVIYVVDARDNLIGVFNTVQRVLDQLMTWNFKMLQLAGTGANIKEMVEASIPIFNNRITVTDYDLNVLAHCRVEDPNLGNVVMSERYERVPVEKSATFAGGARRTTSLREPFFFPEEGRSDNYCINLYFGDNYVGTCSLQQDLRPLRPCDLELFQIFADLVRHALRLQSQVPGGQLVTARAIFDQLLHSFPVSQTDMNHALDLVSLNVGDALDGYKWCCVVIQSARRGKELPERYLCYTVEEILPHATALLFDDAIVAFCLLRRDDHRIDEVCDPLDAYLADMGFKAGISRTFRDPYHARDFYQQAVCALETGYECEPERRWYLFGDYVLDYMLQNCCGDFEAPLVVAPELVRLHNLGTSGVDFVETLRCFLDNDCNASRTAKAMYLHRSTLVQRLDRIREVVDLDTPERKLYLQLCLHLPDVEWALEQSGDIEDFG